MTNIIVSFLLILGAHTHEHSLCPAAPVAGNRIGALSIGASVQAVRARCEIVRDTTELDSEANPQRVLYVRVGTDTVAAEIVDGRVWRLTVSTPTLVTEDGLHVRSPLRAILGRPGVKGLVGEGELYVVSREHCGLSFLVSPTPRNLGRAWNAAALRTLPVRSAIDKILVVGCSNPPHNER